MAVVEQALAFEERRVSLGNDFLHHEILQGLFLNSASQKKKQCPHLCGCQRVCLRQDASVLTQLGQLGLQTVAVPGDLIRRTNKNVRLETKEGLFL